VPRRDWSRDLTQVCEIRGVLNRRFEGVSAVAKRNVAGDGVVTATPISTPPVRERTKVVGSRDPSVPGTAEAIGSLGCGCGGVAVAPGHQRRPVPTWGWLPRRGCKGPQTCSVRGPGYRSGCIVLSWRCGSRFASAFQAATRLPGGKFFSAVSRMPRRDQPLSPYRSLTRRESVAANE